MTIPETKDMNYVTANAITEAMIRYGGSFVSQLGQLFRQADPDNRKRLLVAFPEYFAKYRELALRKAEGREVVVPVDQQD